MRDKDDKGNVLDLAFYKKADPTIRKGVHVRTPSEIERRATPRATLLEILVDVLWIGVMLFVIYMITVVLSL